MTVRSLAGASSSATLRSLSLYSVTADSTEDGLKSWKAVTMLLFKSLVSTLPHFLLEIFLLGKSGAGHEMLNRIAL